MDSLSRFMFIVESDRLASAQYIIQSCGCKHVQLSLPLRPHFRGRLQTRCAPAVSRGATFGIGGANMPGAGVSVSRSSSCSRSCCPSCVPSHGSTH
jgi:hypothetical protein